MKLQPRRILHRVGIVAATINLLRGEPSGGRHSDLNMVLCSTVCDRTPITRD